MAEAAVGRNVEKLEGVEPIDVPRVHREISRTHEGSQKGLIVKGAAIAVES